MVYVATLASGPDRDSSWIREFEGLGWNVMTFSSYQPLLKRGILERVQRRFHIGRTNRKVQQGLMSKVRETRPAWVHFRLPIEFDRGTITTLRSYGSVVTEYFNDDAFSPRTPFGLHWKFRRSLSAYDSHYVYRAHNVESYRLAGARHVEHCPPAYDPQVRTTEQCRPDGLYLADAAFIGHWENDWRVDCLEALQVAGFTLILKGGMWEPAIMHRPLGKLRPISHAFGKEYNAIYGNVVAGLCFFSKINRDTWTERALEIVAVGGVLVCERTDEAERYFTDRQEACFFSSIGELVEVVNRLKNDQCMRRQIQQAGYKRLMKGGNTIRDRAVQVDRFVRSALNSSRETQESYPISKKFLV